MDVPRASSDSSAETELLDRLRVGDAQAFDRIVQQWETPLFAYVRGRLPSDAAALDVLQDVFFRLWRLRETLDAPYGLRVFLYTSARSHLLNAIRTETRQMQRDGAYVRDISQDIVPTEPQESDTALLANAIRHAVDALPERTREVWRLCREEGLTYPETAAVLGISVNTVKTQMGRAFRMIREAALPLLVVLCVVAA